ncbi:cellulose binding domain-containing protein [Modicisalibacter radicis]|uniref:cellulose binding domain-containing protein n=1 Tax=Halomonas sp. EAR18 TaxID=2518972 RepID=UPI00109D7C8B|nr:cellulose binding domain-containing protein [Halomonas sp. EAR18]
MRASIDFKLSSEWNGGAVYEVFITNSGSDPIADYQFGFDLPGTITDIWSASIVSHAGDRYVVGESGNDSDIAPGETVRFKFKVATEGNEQPANFTLNGESLATGDVTTPPAPGIETPDADATPDSPVAMPDDYDFVGNSVSVDSGISAQALQTLIDGAPEGAIIHLAAGDYRFDDSIAIERSDIALVGAGSGETRITFTDEALANDSDTGFLVESAATHYAGKLQADVAEGSDTLTLADGHGLAVGDTVRIWQDNDQAYFDAIGDSSWQKSNAPLRTSMAKIVAVDGDTVTLDRGAHFDFAGGEAKIEQFDALENVTLSGFSVGYELGEPDPGKFSNTLSQFKDYQAIKLNGTVGSELSDIQVINGPGTAFEFALALDLHADSLAAHGSFNKGSGGIGYAYELRESYDGVLTNLEDSGMRHSVLFASWRSSVGNEIEITATDRDINFHGGQDHGNTVHVGQSIRTAGNDGMSTSLWVNQGGESFGAITDMTTNQVTFDYLVGSRRDDVIQGSDDGVYLDGGLGHDRLTGGAGDDILRGGDGWGNDILDGGAGFDTALFDHAFGDYEIRHDDDGSWSFDGPGDDDTLIDIEQARFADGITLDLRSGHVSQGEAVTIPSVEEILANDSPAQEPQPSTPPVDEAPSVIPTPETPEAIEPSEPQAPDESPSPTFSLELETANRWSSGYVMRVTITNTSETAIDNPEIAFDLDADLTTLYNASLLTAEEGRYTVAYTGAHETLDPGDTLSFSFKAYAPETILPEALTLNGHALDVDRSALQAGSAPSADALTTVTSNFMSTWDSGYVAEVFVTNTSEALIEDVALAFDLPSGLDTLWNGQVLESDGQGHYRVSDDEPVSLKPGEAWRFSYKSYDADRTLLDNVRVEGRVDAGDGMAPEDMTLAGGADDDLLFAFDGDDSLSGGDGADRLIGGEGQDTLEGGDGADSFVFRSTFESGPHDADRVIDFDLAEGDVIDLSAIDANLALDGDQAFAWRGDLGFTGAGGELRLEGETLQADVNGDGITDMAIELVGGNVNGAEGLML